MTDRPTDKDTAEVVAWWKGWGEAKYRAYKKPNAPDWFDPNTINGHHILVHPNVKCPRDDTDAALELWHWIAEMVVAEPDGWGSITCIQGCSSNAHEYKLPISGEPFRNAVVRLAVEVKNATQRNAQ